ncbi:hypothetical protein DBR11_05875 [Pedobacter sp. HMWF019]|uniref:hypothetical protein n=1 Tax=Pedobacter sp. HMWF019 TaxID=2056856 RepID=UPI000D3A3F15|nr:hypothetical protein [Pedobacter sp. HMWF019]PTT02070.1 hypothetical protein DBR11_05875 [Pedobacter sp. HMWF019]
MTQKQFPPINLDQAKALTTRWRTYYADLLRAYKNWNNKEQIDINVTPNDKDVFRGFTIPLHDLKKIVEAAENHNNKKKNKDNQIDAVRGYLAMDKPIDKDTPGLVHILLLPVAKRIDITHVSQDDENGTETQESAIYDFSAPCPDVCDTSSPLYSEPL